MTHPIVASARGWIGTRFHHQGRLKKTGNHKGGVDCLGLLVGVARELDLRVADGTKLADFDEVHYPHQPDAARLEKRLSQLLVPVFIPPPLRGEARRGAVSVENSNSPSLTLPLEGEGIIPGDIVLLNIDGNPQHLAIVSDFPYSPLPSGEGLNGSKNDIRMSFFNHSVVRALLHTHRPHPALSRHLLPEGEGNGLGLIHAYAPARAVVEHGLDGWWRQKIEAAFRIPL